MARFRQIVGGLLKRAGCGGRPVRAFGEMVALLWAEGHCGATVRLEYLWHRFCTEESFSLLCAYPRSGFTADGAESMRQICGAHTHVVAQGGIVSRSVNSMRELSKNVRRSAEGQQRSRSKLFSLPSGPTARAFAFLLGSSDTPRQVGHRRV